MDVNFVRNKLYNNYSPKWRWLVTIIPRAQKGSESIAHEAEKLRGHKGREE